jgi:hypothetical protein
MIENTCPAMFTIFPYRQKATKLILTAFSISSTLSRMATAFFRERTPNNPMEKSAADKIRNQESGIMVSYYFLLDAT